MSLTKTFVVALFLVGTKAMALSQLAECFAGNKNNPKVCVSGQTTQAQFDSAWTEALNNGRVSADKKPDYAGIQSGFATDNAKNQKALDAAWQAAGHPGETAPNNFVAGKPLVLPAKDKTAPNDSTPIFSSPKSFEPSAADKASHNDAENSYYKINGKYPAKTNTGEDRKALDAAWQAAGHPGETAPNNFVAGKPLVLPAKTKAADSVSQTEGKAAIASSNDPVEVCKKTTPEKDWGNCKNATTHGGNKVVLDKGAADLRARCDKFEGELSAQHSKIQVACGETKKPANATCFNKIRENKTSAKPSAKKAIEAHNLQIKSNLEAALEKRGIGITNDEYGNDHKRLFKELQKLYSLNDDKDINSLLNLCGKDDKCRTDRYNDILNNIKGQIFAEKEHAKISKRNFFLSDSQLSKLFPENGYKLVFADIQKSSIADAENLDKFEANLKSWKYVYKEGQPTSESHSTTQEKCCKDHSSFWCDGDGKKVGTGESVASPAQPEHKIQQSAAK